MSRHPARSLDFLSRLHDGELTPDERARFESHRAHCDECRRSVADYEASLAFYRGARSSGPPPDLAARILRRLEASNRRRSSFGVVFGIDVKWAGALTAALVAVIFGYSVVERQRASRRIPVSFVEPTPAASTRPAVAAAPAQAPEKAKALRKEASVSASADARRRDEAAAPPAPAAAPEPSRPNAADEKLAAAAPAKAERPSSRSRTAAAHEGGEGASPAEARERALEPKALQRVESDRDVADASSAAPPAPGAAAVRLTVTPLDTLGTPPAVLAGSSSGLSERDRGRYVVVVGPSGVPVAAEREIATRQEVAGVLSAESPLAAIRRLRFAPSDRVRRLLVQIDADAAPR